MEASINILLAEDHEDDVLLLQEAFKKAGAGGRLHVVGDGLEALRYLKGDKPYADRTTRSLQDVLLLDVNMPQRNGFEVLEWVRRDAQCRRLIVHMLTASPRRSDIQRTYDLGATSYVIKPSRINDLVAFVIALHDFHRFTAFPDCLEIPHSS